MFEADLQGRKLTAEEIVGILFLTVLAGLETTQFGIGGAVWYLVNNPEARQRLAREPELIDLAVEEFLRWVSPVQGTGRLVMEDAEINGCPVHRGERVFMLLGSANRDETVFPDPDSVILDRDPNRHLAFGVGPHRCLGSHLAKTVLKVSLQQLVPVLAEWRVADENAVQWVVSETRGLRRLPLVRVESR
jgi:cytochrome P450